MLPPRAGRGLTDNALVRPWPSPRPDGGACRQYHLAVPSYRPGQVGGQIQKEIMEIIHRDLKDPRIGFASVTEVRMSPDLRSARVRVSVLGDKEQQARTIAGLESAKGVIRHELGRRLHNLKFSPELHFELDPSIEYSVRISSQLRELLPPPDPEAPAGSNSDDDGPE